MYGTTQKVQRIARDPVTVSVVATGANSARVTIGQGEEVILKSAQLREAIGLYLMAKNVPDGATVYYRGWLNPKDYGAQATAYLNPAKAFVAAHGEAKAGKLLREAAKKC